MLIRNKYYNKNNEKTTSKGNSTRRSYNERKVQKNYVRRYLFKHQKSMRTFIKNAYIYIYSYFLFI